MKTTRPQTLAVRLLLLLLLLALPAAVQAAEDPFGFDVSWAPGQTVVVEAATDLAAPVWSPVQTLTLTGDSIHFSDPQSKLQPARFYRLRTP